MKFAQCFLALALVGALGAEDQPAPAQIIKGDGKATDVWVTSETIDEVQFLIGKDLSQASKSSFKHGAYQKVVYKDTEQIDLNKGRVFNDKGDFDRSAESYVAAIKSVKYAWQREIAMINAGEAYLKAKKPDQALAMVADFQKTYPKSVYLPRAIDINGRADLAAGRPDVADKSFKTLAGHGSDWGIEAQVAGVMGSAAIQRAAKKPADAATLLSSLLKDVKAETDPEEYVKVAAQLAQDQKDSGKDPDAEATYMKLAYAPVDEGARSRAHLEYARLVSKHTVAGDMITAFDHALLAAVIRGADGKARNEAIALAKELMKKLEADPEAAKDIVEYRNYLSNL